MTKICTNSVHAVTTWAAGELARAIFALAGAICATHSAAGEVSRAGFRVATSARTKLASIIEARGRISRDPRRTPSLLGVTPCSTIRSRTAPSAIPLRQRRPSARFGVTLPPSPARQPAPPDPQGTEIAEGRAMPAPARERRTIVGRNVLVGNFGPLLLSLGALGVNPEFRTTSARPAIAQHVAPRLASKHDDPERRPDRSTRREDPLPPSRTHRRGCGFRRLPAVPPSGTTVGPGLGSSGAVLLRRRLGQPR